MGTLSLGSRAVALQIGLRRNWIGSLQPLSGFPISINIRYVIFLRLRLIIQLFLCYLNLCLLIGEVGDSDLRIRGLRRSVEKLWKRVAEGVEVVVFKLELIIVRGIWIAGVDRKKRCEEKD